MSLIIAKHLETLTSKDGGVPLEILKRSKDEEVNKKTFSDIIDVMKSSGVFPWDHLSDTAEKSGNPRQG